jgi:hypothetical protein
MNLYRPIQFWLRTTLVFLFSTVAVWAGPAAYLDYDPSARAAGMGSAFTALADDASALLFNPAGMTNMYTNMFQAVGSFGILSQDRFNNFLGLSEQLEHKQFVGFDVIQYGVGNVPGFDPNGIPTSILQDMELSFAGSYAYEFDYHFKAGARAGFIYQDLTGVQAKGFGGLDLGVLFVPSPLYDFTLGASLRHLGGFLSWDTGANPGLSPDLRVGACLKLFDQGVVLAYDAERSFQTGANLVHRAGGEIWIEKTVALRGGVDNGNPTLGASSRYLNYGLDYSYEFEEEGLGDSQRISADLFF